MVGDKISELIISLKNASSVKKDNILVPNTKISLSILEVLKNHKFVASFEVNDKTNQINIVLNYDEQGRPSISDVKRISKLSRRVYKKHTEVLPVKNGYGIAVLTTPNGVMSDKEAREQKVGGELMFQIW